MLRFLTAGESHGPALTGIIEGLPAGLPLDADAIDRELRRRQAGYGRGGRMQIERDRVEILAGVDKGLTTGAPLALRIENRDWANWKDRELSPQTIPRPGHADLAGALKYGVQDLRIISERASARETAMRAGIGAVARALLAKFGIRVGGFVNEIGGVVGKLPDLPLAELFELAEGSDVRCPDPAASEAMRERIDQARERGDSLGGIFTVAALDVSVGLGSHVHWDRRLDGRLAQALMSIPGVKGVEVGEGFRNARLPGTQVHDEIFYRVGRIARSTNRAGGVEGGITNGEPVVARAAMKPIPTTLSPLRTVDLVSGKPAQTQYQRSDICAVPAASVVGEAMLAWVLADALAEKLGGDSLAEMKARAEALWGSRT
jgi:chorismate synthase